MSTDKPPQNDDELKEALKALFKEWKEAVSEDLRNKFIVDGAMTGYSEQKVKILFIGRELHSGTPDIVDHVERVLSPDNKNASPNEKQTEDGSTEGRPCWGRALRIVYGLLHGVEKWDEIPDLDYFRKTFRTPEGVSFAIMEASKYKNDDTSSKLSPGFDGYVKECIGENSKKKNFTREEIKLLNPDLIITWDLTDVLSEEGANYYLKKLTESDSHEEDPSNNSKIWTYKFDPSDEDGIPLIDTWHLSTFNKESEAEIYTPIVEAAKNKCEKVKDIFDKRKENADKIENEGPNALPGYSVQKWKILFVDKDYKDEWLEVLSGKDRIDGWLTRALRITYGLLHNVEKWDKIPNPNYFRTTFKTPEGVSFAAVGASVENADKEIDRLKPDLIITCNLGDLAEKLCGDSHKDFPEGACIGMGMYKGIPLIDARKIVSKGKKIRDSYESIREAVKKLIEQGKLKERKS